MCLIAPFSTSTSMGHRALHEAHTLYTRTTLSDSGIFFSSIPLLRENSWINEWISSCRFEAGFRPYGLGEGLTESSSTGLSAAS